MILLKNWLLRFSLIFLSLGLAALIFAGAMMFLPDQGPDTMTPSEPQIKTGWQYETTGTYFYDDTGNYITGLFPCPQGTYYFDETGRMITGWQSFPEGTRYFDSNGWMHVGWLELEGKRYCFDREGLMVTGWQELQGQRYYFSASGALAVGWQETEDGKFYFDENNKIHTGWLYIEEGTWYLQDDGTPYTGWMQTDVARYYFLDDGKMATGMIKINDQPRLFSPKGNYIPLVNPWNPVPEDYTEKLVDIEGHKMDFTCVDALAEMIADAREAGLTCVLNSSYRDMNTQIYLWDKRYNDYLSQGYSEEEAYRLTARRVAYPGTSEHHTGLAIDIVEIIKDGTLYEWFNQHAWEYGFIVRYKGEKETITGIKDEPWHLRYVGVEIAQIIQERDICLEEYFNELNS